METREILCGHLYDRIAPERSLFLREVEFRIPEERNLNRAEALIERVCAERGLHVAMKGSLASYPGSIHWHFKKNKEKGTMEITLLKKDHRIWAQVQDGRKADWIDKELPGLRRAVEKELR